MEPCPAFSPGPDVSGVGAKLGGASGVAIDGEEGAGLGTTDVVRSGKPDEEGIGAVAGGPAGPVGARWEARPALLPAGEAGLDRPAASGALRALREPFAGAPVSLRDGALSAGRVTVPPMLKFCNSRGPTAFGAGVLVVGGGVLWGGVWGVVWTVFWPVLWPALWASACVPSDSPTANASIPKRKSAFIRSRSCTEARSSRARCVPCLRGPRYSSTERMNRAGLAGDSA